MEEVATAIKLMKNNKAPGLDRISAELLKHGGCGVIRELTHLCNICWNAKQTPEDWRNGTIVTVPKKGNLTDCNNWRGITLLSIPGKIFCAVLLHRLRDEIDVALRQEQAGFRNGRSCSEQIFILRNIIEQSLEFQTQLLINFIDFRKAFDSHPQRHSLEHCTSIMAYRCTTSIYFKIYTKIQDAVSGLKLELPIISISIQVFARDVSSHHFCSY